nr:hypothetical protein [Tanacetum cinerariifolium]
PRFACRGGLVVGGLQERYGLKKMDEGVAGKGVQALGGKVVHSAQCFENVGGDRLTGIKVWVFYNFGPCG